MSVLGVIVEIRAAEGGDDAKALVLEQAAIYVRRAARLGVRLEVSERLPSLLTFRASGRGAAAAFADEPGGHRWQRVPPNEKRGRVHTSTVTVAVLLEPSPGVIQVAAADVQESVARGSGPGGQHRNKTESCVSLRHLPTGITVRCDEGRSQTMNREIAWSTLRARIFAAEEAALRDGRDRERRGQVGSGMRGDKRRTIRCQDGVVTDHVTGRRWPLRSYLRGEW